MVPFHIEFFPQCSGTKADSPVCTCVYCSVPRMRGKLETIPTEEKYLDYDCYLNTYDPFGCYRTRQSYRYEYVTEVFIS